MAGRPKRLRVASSDKADQEDRPTLLSIAAEEAVPLAHQELGKIERHGQREQAGPQGKIGGKRAVAGIEGIFGGRLETAAGEFGDLPPTEPARYATRRPLRTRC